MSGLRCDVLVIVDAVTLLSAYPEASRDPAAPTVIDGRHLYVVSPATPRSSATTTAASLPACRRATSCACAKPRWPCVPRQACCSCGSR